MKSKVLEYLGVSEKVSKDFPEDIKEFVAIIDGSQDIYSESKDSSQKDKLAELIVTWMRQLMEYLKGQNLGIYANANVMLEDQTLPREVNAPTPPPTPPSTPRPPQTPPQTPPQAPPPSDVNEPPSSTPPEGGDENPPSPPTPPSGGGNGGSGGGGTPPPSEEHKPPFTREELEEAIDILSDADDEESLQELDSLRSMYNRYYS